MAEPVETTTLANGLRVVVLPDPTSPVAALAVHYDVGFRSEPQGATGFAHLFEHLMFQGSKHLAKGELPRLLEGSGGIFNGFTRPDATVYFEQFPVGALELALFCEADRMRAPVITEETLANQIAVVKEEIRLNVFNQPYGGFPWLFDLPPTLFQTFANAHNGYGSFTDLEAASLEDVRRFFDGYYAPGNAVVTIAGGPDASEVMAAVERHFGPIPARPVPSRPSFAEAMLDGERRVERTDALAPLPALALGFRVPDPLRDGERFSATVVLASLLADGHASRLFDRLVRRDQLAANVGTMWGGLDSPWFSRDPTYLAFVVHYPDVALTDRIVAVIDEEIAAVAAGVGPGAMEPVLAQLASEQWLSVDRKYQLALQAGFFEQQRGDARLALELADRLTMAAPLASDVAAEWLATRNRALCTLVPGSAA